MSTTLTLWPVQEFGAWGYVDAGGRMAIAPRFAVARHFCEGLAVVCVNRAWGYVGPDGDLVIPARYSEAGDFEGGRAVCRPQGAGGEEPLAGVIDAGGAWVVAPQWKRVERYDEAFWEVTDEDERIGWLNARGEVVVAPRFEDSRVGARGLLVAGVEGAFFFVDLAAGGRLVAVEGVDEIGWVGDDTLPARRGDRWGWLGADGAWLLPPAWDGVEPFAGDCAIVTAGERKGLVDRRGRVVVEPEHPRVMPAFDGHHPRVMPAFDGHFWVGDEEQLWLVDTGGVRRSGPWLELSYAAPTGAFFARGPAGWGVFSKQDGAVLLPPVMEEVADGGDGLVKVRVGERWGVRDPHAGPDAPWILAPEHERLDTFYDGAIFAEGRCVLLDREGRTLWRRPPPRVPRLPPVAHRTADWSRVPAVLERLRASPDRRIFGGHGTWGEHEFAIGPALSEAELVALETQHRVRLPAELRTFLATVGNGPGLPGKVSPVGFETHGGAGPGYGVYDIRKMLAGSPRAHAPFVPARTRAEVEAAVETDDDSAPAGFVIFGTHGCAYDYGVVITGPWAGTVWTYVDPGWIPATEAFAEILGAHHADYTAAHDWLRAHLEEVPVQTFADYYLAWLDKAEGA